MTEATLYELVVNSSAVTLSPAHIYSPGGWTNQSMSGYDLSNDTATGHRSTGHDSEYHRFQQVVDKLIIFGIPAIIIIGMLGNTLSFVVFVCTHLRYQSCSVYLAFLNLVDMGFLLCLGIIWFEWLRMNLFHRQVMCQLIIYLSYICAFLSSWTVVTFTIERYIVVFYPLKKHVLCTPRRAKFIVLSITIVSLALYSFSTWMNGVVDIGNRKMCVPLRKYYKVLQGFTAADTLITFLIPSLLIIVLNIGIVIKICDFIYRRGESGSFVTEESGQLDRTLRTGQCHCSKGCGQSGQGGCGRAGMAAGSGQGKAVGNGGGQGRNSGGSGSGQGRGNGSGSDNGQGKKHATGSGGGGSGGGGSRHVCKLQVSRGSRCSSQKRQLNFVFSSAMPHSKLPCARHNYQIRTTRALVIVSSVYVLLNLPSHAFRAIACIIYLTDVNFTFPKNALIWQNVLQLVYYLNFASNVFLYSASSRSFRSALRRLLNRWRHKAQSAYTKVRTKPLPFSFPIDKKHRGDQL